MLPLSFPYRSLIVPLSFPYRSLILPLSFPYRSLIVPLSFPYRFLILAPIILVSSLQCIGTHRDKCGHIGTNEDTSGQNRTHRDSTILHACTFVSSTNQDQGLSQGVNKISS